MKRVFDVLGKLNWGKRACAVFALCATTAIALPAQTFTTLYSFCSQSGCTDGGGPFAGLVQATNGGLYGTTASGGEGCYPGGCGTVFKITPSGALTTVHEFDYTDGSQIYSGLVQGTNGDLYGTAYAGGANGAGTVFKMTPTGKLTTLYSFCPQSGCTDGQGPYTATLVRGTNGDFYGTTAYAGANGYGTVFKITPSGKLTTLHSFCSQANCADGGYPYAGLVQATNGDFYGTTNVGGFPPGGGGGTVFKISPSGTLTTLYTFCSPNGCNGASPYAGLVQATNGDLYGTTLSTIFKITLGGKLTTLYTILCQENGCLDTFTGALIQATDGNLYGTTDGGTASAGTVFKITPGGKLTTLYSFCPQTGCADGKFPYAGLVQATNGSFYGTTFIGGGANQGTVFSLSIGLGPFVETLPASGKLGAVVEILGTDLTGATSVTFNGTAAVFTVDSTGSAISTTVPAGATTGTVQVVTPTGTLSSNVPFKVP